MLMDAFDLIVELVENYEYTQEAFYLCTSLFNQILYEKCFTLPRSVYFIESNYLKRHSRRHPSNELQKRFEYSLLHADT